MIYLKRTLWLLGWSVVWILFWILLMMAFIFICFFNTMFLYIKNGNIQGYDDCLDRCFKLIDWYSDIEPKED